MQEPEHVIQLLEKTEKAVEREDVIRLKDLSNQTIHSSSIHQDPDNITVAVIIYSLSKILERTSYKEYPGWNTFFNSFMKHINRAIFLLKQEKIEKLREELEAIRKDISNLTGNFKMHVKDVFQKASISKASRIYEHGISMEKTAKLLGISLFELALYAGQTGISDVNLGITMPVKERIKIVFDIFDKTKNPEKIE